MKRFWTLFVLLLADCSVHTKVVKLAVPLAFMLSAGPVSADTTFEATWNVIPGDSVNIEYQLYIDSIDPPVKLYWTGRETVTAGKMVKQFLLSTLLFPTTVTKVCGYVRARDKTSTKVSNPSIPTICVPVDLIPLPDTPTGFGLSAK